MATLEYSMKVSTDIQKALDALESLDVKAKQIGENTIKIKLDVSGMDAAADKLRELQGLAKSLGVTLNATGTGGNASKSMSAGMNAANRAAERLNQTLTDVRKKISDINSSSYDAASKSLAGNLREQINGFGNGTLTREEIRRQQSLLNGYMRDLGDASMTSLTSLQSRIADSVNKYSGASKAIRNQWKALQSEADAMVANGTTSYALKDMQARFNKLTTQTRKTGNNIVSMFSEFGKTSGQQFMYQLSNFFSPYVIVGYIKEMLNTVVQLDDALIDLKKTTTMSSAELERFYFSANDVAKQMGVTTQTILESAAAWSRLGYSSEEAATKMAELSAQFTAISPGIADGKADDYLASIMQAFGIDVADVESEIMDKINIIGNTMATSNAEIGEMLLRSSAAMKEANNTLQETIALESAAVEVTRNAEMTGTAFRTASMRIRGYDEETEELSADLENLSGKIADVTKTAKTPGGISLFTDKDKSTYKSTYQIFKDISEIYDDLTDKQQAELLELLGGKRGGNVLATVLSNFSSVEEAMETMNNAAGSSDREMGIITESLSYKINQLKETWVGFAQETIDRGDLGGLIDGLTSLSEGITGIISKVGLLNTAVAALFAVIQSRSKSWQGITGSIQSWLGDRIDRANGLTLTTSQFRGLGEITDETKSGLASLVKAGFGDRTLKNLDVKSLTDGLKELKNDAVASNMAISDLSRDIGRLSAPVSKGTAALKSLGSSLAGIGISMGIGLAVSAAIQGISALIKYVERLNNASKYAKQFTDSLRQSRQEATANVKALNELQDEYDELSKGVSASGQNVSLSSDEYERYKEIISEISGIMPGLSVLYNGQGEAIGFARGELEKYNGSLEKAYELERRRQANEFLDRDAGDEGGSAEDVYRAWTDTTGVTEGFLERFGYQMGHLFDFSNRGPDSDVEETLQRVVDAYNGGDTGELRKIIKRLRAGTGTLTTGTEQLADINFDDLLSGDRAKINDAMKRINAAIRNASKNIDTEYENVRAVIRALTESGRTMTDYYELSSQEQDMFEQLLTNFSHDIPEAMGYSLNNEEDLKAYADRLMELARDAGLRNAWESLSNLDTSDISYGDYSSAMDAVADKLAEALGLDGEGKLKLMVSLGFDTADIDAGLPRLKAIIAGITGEDGSEWLDSLSVDDLKLIIENVDEYKGALNRLKKSSEGAASSQSLMRGALRSFKGELRDAADEAESFADGLGGAFSSLEKLDAVGDIYNDVADGGDFDFSKLFDDKLREALGGSYDAFAEGVLRTNGSIHEAQKYFNDLATEWAYGEDVLGSLTEENAALTAQMMKQAGITNAEAMVEERLRITRDAQNAVTREKIYLDGVLITTTDQLNDLTLEEISRLLDESDASDEARAAIMRLWLAKNTLNGTTIRTEADIRNLSSLLEALGMTEVQAINTARAIANISKAESSATSTEGLRNEKFSQNRRKTGADSNLDSVLNELGGTYERAVYNPTSTSGGGNAGNGGRSSSARDAEEEAKAAEEQFDWIERRISKIQTRLDDLDQVATGTYHSWEERAIHLNEEIAVTGQMLETQQQAYARYMAEANKVDLSDDYKNKVISGLIDIETVTDETVKENIQKFQQWIDKANEAERQFQDLRDSLAALARLRFDNIVTMFDSITGHLEREKTLLDEFISRTEEAGYIVSTKYYDSLIAYTENNVKRLEKQQEDLLRGLTEAMATGKIAKGTQEWYDMVQQIDEVNVAIEEGKTALIEYANAIREIEWGVFDYMQEQIGRVTEEAKFLVDLMSNKKLFEDGGQLTDQGWATMGMHGMNYDVYMEQADRYREEARQIDAELAKDPYNKNLIARRKELISLQRESILAAEAEKDAIKEMVEEGINLELDSLKELIDAYNDALDAQKDLYDYQKKVAEQVKNIASLEKQMAAYQGDDSEENKARLQRLKVELEEARGDLEETQYDKFIDDQKKLLDELYLQYEEILNMRLDNIDMLLSDMIDALNENSSSIQTTLMQVGEDVGYQISTDLHDIWGEMNNVLCTYGDRLVGAMTSLDTYYAKIDNLISAMVSASNARADSDISGMRDYDDRLNEASGGASGGGRRLYNPNTGQHLFTSDQNEIRTLTGMGWRDEGASPIQSSGGEQLVRLYNPTSGDHIFTVRGSREYNAATANGYIEDSSRAGVTAYTKPVEGSTEVTRLYNPKTGKHLYTSDQNEIRTLLGMGWVKDSASLYVKGRYKGVKNLRKDELAWTQERGREAIIRPSDGAILTPLKAGDSVLNAKATAALFDFASNPMKFLEGLGAVGNVTALPTIGGMTVGDVNNSINISLPDVTDYDGFINAMRSDRQFEKIIQDMTVNQLFGGSAMRKYSR